MALPTPLEPPKIPPATRLYAIGDLHGRADLLRLCAQNIARDLEGFCGEVLTVALGDMIDRGPDSAGVLAFLRGAEFPTPVVALRGNHEQVMLDALDDANLFEQWLHFGGLATLASFGVDPRRGFAACRDALREKAADDLEFLLRTPFSYVCGDYFFCHAGVRPKIALYAQKPVDLMTIRHEFLGSSLWHGKKIVHGHTPSAAPEFLANRVGLDTGAYATGRLSCAVFEHETIRLLGASP